MAAIKQISGVVDGASAIAHELDTTTALANPTAKLLSVKNAGVEKFSLDKDGVPSGTGLGNVVGPASSTDNAIARFDTTTGKLLQNSSVLLDDSGNIIPNVSGAELGSTASPFEALNVNNGVTDGGTIKFDGGNLTLKANAAGTDLEVGGTATLFVPETNATIEIGSTTKNFKRIFLDNGATDGGAVNFDGGTSRFLKSSADGLALAAGGFTSIIPNTDAVTSLGNSTNQFTRLFLDAASPSAASNVLSAAQIVKGWAKLTVGVGTVTVTDHYNVVSASVITSVVNVVWDVDFANTDYVCIAVHLVVDSNRRYLHPTATNVGSTDITKYDTSNGSASSHATGDVILVLAIGDQ